MKDNQKKLSTVEKLYAETAVISWLELQRFFAQGLVLNVDPALDLVEVAVMFADDDAPQIDLFVKSGKVAAPSNEQARQWYEQKTDLWSVVVAPFVLVQNKPTSIKER